MPAITSNHQERNTTQCQINQVPSETLSSRRMFFMMSQCRNHDTYDANINACPSAGDSLRKKTRKFKGLRKALRTMHRRRETTPIDMEIQRAAETQLDVECTPAKFSSQGNTTVLPPNSRRNVECSLISQEIPLWSCDMTSNWSYTQHTTWPLTKDVSLKTTPNQIHGGSVSPATRKAPIRLHKKTVHV